MAGEPESRSGAQRPGKEPHGPGMLMIFAIVLVAVAIWCGYDLFLSGEASGEKADDITWFIFNYAGMIGGGLLAIYCLILAAVRAKKGVGAPAGAGPAEGTPSEQQGGPPEAPPPQEATPETEQEAPKEE